MIIYHCELLKDMGIHINFIRFNNAYHQYFVKLITNPKRVINNKDFISVTHEWETEEIFRRINDLLASVGLYENINAFSVSRIDFCHNHNFYSQDLAEKYMMLLKRAVWLRGLDVYTAYSEKQHRCVDSRSAVYARNKSVTVNFYDKHSQEKGNPKVTSIELLEYRGIIRFEFQCMKPKVQSIKEAFSLPTKQAAYLTNEHISENILLHYIKKIFRSGVFYTLPMAKGIISRTNFRQETKDVMCDILATTADRRGLQTVI